MCGKILTHIGVHHTKNDLTHYVSLGQINDIIGDEE